MQLCIGLFVDRITTFFLPFDFVCTVYEERHKSFFIYFKITSFAQHFTVFCIKYFWPKLLFQPDFYTSVQATHGSVSSIKSNLLFCSNNKFFDVVSSWTAYGKVLYVYGKNASFNDFSRTPYLCGLLGLHWRKAIWCRIGCNVSPIIKYSLGATYLARFELSSFHTCRIAANRSVGQLLCQSMWLSNVILAEEKLESIFWDYWC